MKYINRNSKINPSNEQPYLNKTKNGEAKDSTANTKQKTKIRKRTENQNQKYIKIRNN